MSTSVKIAVGAAVGLLLFPAVLVSAAFGAVSSILGGGGDGGGSVRPSATALADIPADYLALYQAAATVCPGLSRTVLAGIGKVESDHGRSTLTGVASGANQAGAGGPMQILQPTWNGILARHRIPPGGASPPSRYDPHDAIYAAAYYLCDNGAARDVRAAVFAYNHSQSYVTDVFAQAARYAATPTTGSSNTAGGGDAAEVVAPSDPAATAALFALDQVGQPLRLGRGRRRRGWVRLLTHAAYAAAGVTIPRTADTQWRAGPPVPAEEPLAPGDLLFYGANGRATHVALYLGGGQVVHAPDVGQLVQVADANMPGYLGATRPGPPGDGPARVP